MAISLLVMRTCFDGEGGDPWQGRDTRPEYAEHLQREHVATVIKHCSIANDLVQAFNDSSQFLGRGATDSRADPRDR